MAGVCGPELIDGTGVYALVEARDTVDREGALDWHCSLLCVMKAGRELNCFLHFPHRNTSSSSVGRTNTEVVGTRSNGVEE